jgi:hypothetical protein
VRHNDVPAGIMSASISRFRVNQSESFSEFFELGDGAVAWLFLGIECGVISGDCWSGCNLLIRASTPMVRYVLCNVEYGSGVE